MAALHLLRSLNGRCCCDCCQGEFVCARESVTAAAARLEGRIQTGCLLFAAHCSLLLLLLRCSHDDSANKMAFCVLAISLDSAVVRMRQSETTAVYTA